MSTFLDVAIGLGLVWFSVRYALSKRGKSRIALGEFRSSEISKLVRDKDRR